MRRAIVALLVTALLITVGCKRRDETPAVADTSGTLATETTSTEMTMDSTATTTQETTTTATTSASEKPAAKKSKSKRRH